MSDQPKKQELPPIERMERTVKCCVCGWYTAGVPQAELLAALSDNEAKDARIAELEKESAKWKSHSEAAWERADGTFMDTLGLVTRNQAAEAKLKSVEGLLEEKEPLPRVMDTWSAGRVMAAEQVEEWRDALLARIREAIK